MSRIGSGPSTRSGEPAESGEFPVYRAYGDVQPVVGDLEVMRVSLIVDSGWGSAGDQVLDVSNVTVNDITFVPKTVETRRTTVPAQE